MNFAGFSKCRLSEQSSTANSTSFLRGLDVLPNQASAKQFKASARPMNKKELSQMMNAETLEFLSKYFPDHYDQDILLQDFVCAILKEYEGLWTADQATRIQTQFMDKLSAMLETRTYIDIIKLTTLTLDNGMIGLILTIFRRLKEDEDTNNISETASNITNLKNVLQQFVEGLYASLEKQLYGQFNNQMRRMILKYKQTDKMIKRLNELINEHADTILHAQYVKKLTVQHEAINRNMEKEITRLKIALEKQEFVNDSLRKEVNKLSCENDKLNNKLEKYQESLIWGRRQPEHQQTLPSGFLGSAHAHPPYQHQPPDDTSVSPKTTAKGKHLNFFVGGDRNISLGDDRSTLWSKGRFSHPNKQNFADLQNRLQPERIR